MSVGILQQYSNKNFFAYICTPWQIKGVEVAVELLKNEGKDINAVVFVADHNITGRCIDAKDCPERNEIEWVNVSFSEFIEGIVNSFSNIKRLIYLPLNFLFKNSVYVYSAGKLALWWLYVIPAVLKKHVIFIFGDDGSGGYIGYGNYENQDFLHRNYYKFCFKLLKKTNRCIDQRILLYKKGNKFEQNKVVAKKYQEILAESEETLASYIIDAFSGNIVLNTQCLFDNKEINGEQDLNVLRVLKRTLMEVSDRVVIRPHPREASLDRYNEFCWDVIAGVSITQEEIFSKLEKKPKMIIGIYSSTLINLKALFGVDTISLVYFYRNEDISDGEKKSCDDFINTFGNYIMMPKNEEELKWCIYNIIKKYELNNK